MTSEDRSERKGAEEERPETRGLERRLGYCFRDSTLLDTALAHSSWANETPDAESNERLEFLGDAVVGLVVAHRLYVANPSWREGELTRGLHDLVDRKGLARLARDLDIGPHLRLGRTERQSDGQRKESILADAMEAIIAAIYLDGGLDAVIAFASRVYGEALEPDATPVGRDPKTRLQEEIMAEFGEFPTYELLVDNGVEGDSERFCVQVRVRGDVFGTGVGRSKRAAERVAAERALRRAAGRSGAGGT